MHADASPRRGHARRGALLVAGLIGLAALVPHPARAAAASAAAPSRIVYVCGSNLCAIDPATRAATQITGDGAGYDSPSVSADGRRIAARRGQGVIAGAVGSNLPERWGEVRGLNDVAISPDGKAVAATYWYSELVLVYRYTCGGLCSELQYSSGVRYWTSAGGPPRGFQGTSGVGFLGGGTLLSTGGNPGDYDDETFRFGAGTETVCTIADTGADGVPCVDRVVEPNPPLDSPEPKLNFTDPAGSPDGRLIAAVLGRVPTTAGRIVDDPTGESPAINVYDAGSGAKVAQLAANATKPTFSPDSREVAYSGADGWIYVVPARGGTPRRLVAGSAPTWAAGSFSGAAVDSGTVRYRGGRIAVKVRCGGSAACSGTITLKKGKTTIGRRTYRVAAGRTAAVAVKATARGQRTISRARKLAVALQLQPKGAGVSVVPLTIRR